MVAPDPTCGAGVRTRVAVAEGVVVVRHAGAEDRVATGEQWPPACVRGPAAAPPAVAQASSTTPPPPNSPGSGSTLADQNDLYAAAVLARRRGDARTALALLDRFVSIFPSSPLAENVMVERMRLTASGAPVRSARLAREYLAHYPNGFARAEAEAILTEAP